MLTIQSFTFSPLQENTYVIFNQQGDCCIIDPGCYFGNERNELKDFISETGLTPKYLLNTHCHLDHVFGEKFVAATYGLTPYIHELEQPVMEYAPISAQKWGLPFDPYKGAFHFLREGDIITLGEDKFKVLFTPGHSPGSISFYCYAQQFVIGGDVLFRESIGRTDLPGGNFNTLATSIRTQLFVLPDEVVVYSGHGAETTIGHEKKHNPFLRP